MIVSIGHGSSSVIGDAVRRCRPAFAASILPFRCCRLSSMLAVTRAAAAQLQVEEVVVAEAIAGPGRCLACRPS